MAQAVTGGRPPITEFFENADWVGAQAEAIEALVGLDGASIPMARA